MKLRSHYASPFLREKLVNMIYDHGYGDPNRDSAAKTHARWTRQEMLSQCEDLCLLDLWKRYVTIWPDPEEIKKHIEKEYLLSIEVTKMVEGD